MLVTKVVLGKSQTVTAALQSCPSGFDSVSYLNFFTFLHAFLPQPTSHNPHVQVVFDKDGPHNETIVYTDDAIRPVFLIMF
jgi:hypothetical protein